MHQHHGLNELDIAELGVPVDVRGADQQPLVGLARVVRGAAAALPGRVTGLQHSGQTDVVLRRGGGGSLLSCGGGYGKGERVDWLVGRQVGRKVRRDAVCLLCGLRKSR